MHKQKLAKEQQTAARIDINVQPADFELELFFFAWLAFLRHRRLLIHLIFVVFLFVPCFCYFCGGNEGIHKQFLHTERGLNSFNHGCIEHSDDILCCGWADSNDSIYFSTVHTYFCASVFDIKVAKTAARVGKNFS